MGVLLRRAAVALAVLGVVLCGAGLRAEEAGVTVSPATLAIDPARDRVIEVPTGSPTGPGAGTAHAPNATVTVFQDDFEGTLPGSWSISWGGPEAYWQTVTYKYQTGAQSAYCAAGGPQAVQPPGPYLPNMNTWLKYGPFSLADASAATASFAYWLDCEGASGTTYFDYLFYGISTDGSNFSGYKSAGRVRSWTSRDFAFSEVPSIPTAGKPEVWFAFFFKSDGSTQYEGAYVDALRITKTTTGVCTLSCGSTVPATGVVGTPVQFQGTTTPSGCSSTPTIGWDFGDMTGVVTGGTVNHTYQTPGVYSWAMTSTVDGQTCQRTGTITVLEACLVSCNATVPTTVQAGSSASFQSIATTTGCTQALGFLWSFGDGSAPAASQNASHAYASPGVYDWSLTVTSGGTLCQKTGQITVTSSCQLACNPTVPATGQVGVAVPFQASVTATGCTQALAYTWSFGDGTAGSTAQGPTHTYAAAGIYTWTLTASSGSATCTRTGTIEITQAQTFTDFYWEPVVSHAPGVGGSQWRTDLGLLNTGTATAHVELRLFGGTTPLVQTTEVGAGVQSILTDVVGQFGFSGSGALEVRSDRPLAVTSRTYNQTTAGTYGQGYDSLLTEQGATAGQSVLLPQLTEDASYRTNIAVTNTGTTDAAVTVELFSGSGQKLADYQVLLTPGQWRQENQPFRTKAGQTAMARGWARLTVTQGSGIVAYASVIDARTSDPTTVSMKRAPAGAGTLWVPVVSRASGAAGSQWRTDLGVLNVGSATASLQLVLHGTSATSPQTLQLAAGSQAIEVDVVSRFGYGGSGSLEVISDQPVIVTSRTYNQATNGTFGQDYDGVLASQGAAAPNGFYLPQLSENPAYRTNIGLTNAGSLDAAATVELYSGAGQKLTEYTVSLSPGQQKQENAPFKNKAGQTNMARGYARVTVTAGSGVIGYASVVDNTTSDPTTVAMKTTTGGVVETGLVTGIVRNLAGQVVGGVTVSVPGVAPVTTNEQGYFSLGSVPATQRAMISFAKQGFVDATEIAEVAAGESQILDVVIAQVETAATVSGSGGGTVTTPDGGMVTISPGTLVTSTGAPFLGTATVAVTTFDPSVATELTAFPGEFEGVTLTGATTPFNTFGFMDVSVSSGTETLQLGSGSTATIEVPIPATLGSGAPSTMPSWWFDPDDARWHEVGTFVRYGSVYRTEIPHFSVWNCDVAAARCTVVGRVVDGDGNPVKGARVEFRSYRPGGGYVTSGETSTPADGTFRVPVDANATVEYWAKKGTIESVRKTTTSCQDGGEQSVGDIVLGGSSGTGVAVITVSWTANPRDLDAHLTVPRSDGTWEHVYYAVKGQVKEDAKLDTDDQDGYGPEIVTVLKGHSGTYRYSLHHYAGTSTISGSGAVVTVQALGVGIRTFTPPAGATASKDVWHVFDLTFADGTFSITGLGDYLHGVSADDITKFQPGS